MQLTKKALWSETAVGREEEKLKDGGVFSWHIFLVRKETPVNREQSAEFVFSFEHPHHSPIIIKRLLGSE